MSAEEILNNSEKMALNHSQFVSNVTGKSFTKGTNKKKTKAFGAVGFLTAMIVIFAVLFGSGNLIPSAISERLIEETDVQYADAVESKKLVFEQALLNGNIPNNTVSILKGKGVLVGYLDNGSFNETNQHDGGLVLKKGDKIIKAEDFIKEVSSDVELYNAFNEATYSRAAYYYDESAQKVFKKIGTSRNNYTDDAGFDDVMTSLTGKGSNISINGVIAAEQEVTEEGQESQLSFNYVSDNGSANSNSDNFIEKVIEKNPGASDGEAILNAADSLKVADSISKEQRSSLFFITFMENISKMKAGKGNDSKINEAMNYLYKKEDSEIVDVDNGEIIRNTGTALESPSLYAVLSKSTVDSEAVKNYSSDRILNTIENSIGNHNTGGIITNTVVSVTDKIRGAIGRFINSGGVIASSSSLNIIEPTVRSSLVENSYDTIKGINAGEFLVEGAVNVGKELAKASGGTPGDTFAVRRYAKLNNTILAMDAKADRLNRSPFDVTSKNTFLGSIIYNMAIMISRNSNGFLSSVSSFSRIINTSLFSLLPTSHADESAGYLTTTGNCKTQITIGAVGSPQCAENATFDLSTLNNIFNDPGFIDFVNKNTSLSSSGNRTINHNSDLAKFIEYNNERTSPIGVIDGSILNSEQNNSSSTSFVSNIMEMVKNLFNSSDSSKRYASGAAFVNSSSNRSWSTYKYAQRYVSLARATEALRQYADDETAYNNIQFFEGNENPVIAYLNDYYAKLYK